MSQSVSRPIPAGKTPAPSAEDLELFIGFAQECDEKLTELENLILQFESDAANTEHAKGIYRILHTIKGTAASVGLSEVAHFAHEFEDSIAPFRAGSQTPQKEHFSLFLSALELLKKIFEKLKMGQLIPIEKNFWSVKIQTQNKTEQSAAQPAQSDKGKARKITIDLDIVDQVLSRSGNLMLLSDLIMQDLEEASRRYPNETIFKNSITHLIQMEKENDYLQTQVGKLKKTNISSVLRMAHRTIRDLSIQLGKQIKVELLGSNVAIDFDVSQILTDSIVHLTRNAVDHGIESPAERVEKGKPKEAFIQIHVHQSNEDLILEIKDDGRGIDSEKIKQKALAKNLLPKEKLEALSKENILKLIFESGFSTADKVTEVSGRGVGLDMVQKSIQSLKGRVQVKSEVNRGTTFVITIPEKKVSHISKSFLAKLGNKIIAIDSENVLEIKSIEQLKNQNQILLLNNFNFISSQNEFLEVIDPLFKRKTVLPDQGTVFIISGQNQRYCIYANEVIGLEKVIVKNIEHIDIEISGFKKAALSGRFGLILYADLSTLNESLDITDRSPNG